MFGLTGKGRQMITCQGCNKILHRVKISLTADLEYELDYNKGVDEYRQIGKPSKPEEKTYSVMCPYCYTLIESSYYLVSDGETYDLVRKDLGEYGQYRIKQ